MTATHVQCRPGTFHHLHKCDFEMVERSFPNTEFAITFCHSMKNAENAKTVLSCLRWMSTHCMSAAVVASPFFASHLFHDVAE